MSKRTPYDTGKRSEPKPWQSWHIEDDDDYGKVDFEDDAGGTLAVLYIEHDDDGTWALRGQAWQSLKLDIESNDPSDEDLTITVVQPAPPEGMETVIFDWSTEKGRCYDCGLPAAYRLTHIAVESGDFLLCSVCAAYHAAHGDEIEYLFEERYE